MPAHDVPVPVLRTPTRRYAEPATVHALRAREVKAEQRRAEAMDAAEAVLSTTTRR